MTRTSHFCFVRWQYLVLYSIGTDSQWPLVRHRNQLIFGRARATGHLGTDASRHEKLDSVLNINIKC